MEGSKRQKIAASNEESEEVNSGDEQPKFQAWAEHAEYKERMVQISV